MPIDKTDKFSIFNILKAGEHSQMAMLAIIVGILAGFGAVGFRYLIIFFQLLAYGSSDTLIEVVKSVPWHLRIAIPAVGGLIIGPMVYFFAREAKGHGVPEVMESVAMHGGVIRKRIVAIKTLVSAICIATGGSVGREGPIVQIGSAIGSFVGQTIKTSPNRMRTLVGCGAAAGIAATFNAPIAGTMFTLEIILGEFGVATFSPIVISAVMATAISRHFLGDFPAFIVPTYQLVSVWEFPLYLVLGLICTLVGLLFVKALYFTEDLFDNFKFPEYLKAAVGGVILGCMGLAFPQILGVGYGAIDLALIQELSWWLMLVLVLVKVLATSITIGSGGSGGIFAPSLFLGAMTGGAFGMMVNSLFPTITASPGAYAIVGMAAVVSATTHGSLTAILMLFEMTGEYTIILPLMMTCIVSALAVRNLSRESIYTLKLVRRGIDIREGREVNVLKSISVKEIMNSQVETVTERMNMGEISDRVSKSRHNSFPVLDNADRLIGILSYNDYREALFDQDLKDLVVARDLATMNPVTVTMENNLYDALQIISQRDFSIIPVVSSKDASQLMGVISRRDINGTYEKAVVKLSLLNQAKYN
jgi:CIC family chloride channel protein